MKNCLGFWTMLKERLVSCFEELFLFFPFHPLLLLHESLHKKPLKELKGEMGKFTIMTANFQHLLVIKGTGRQKTIYKN